MSSKREHDYTVRKGPKEVLAMQPHVELQDGPVKRDYIAREVTGDEKAVWWERAVAAYPDYADYQKKTTREIPVFVLSPMGEQPR